MVISDGDDHDHSSLSPSLSPDSNRHIRTDLSADGTTRAGIVIITNYKEISLTVYFLSHPNQLLRTGDRAEPTTLATLSINLDFGHHHTRWNTGIMQKWNDGFKKKQPFFCLIFHQSITPCYIASTSLKC
jgi:hypothetical protein